LDGSNRIICQSTTNSLYKIKVSYITGFSIPMTDGMKLYIKALQTKVELSGYAMKFGRAITAIIIGIYIPDYIWLASGGINNINKDTRCFKRTYVETITFNTLII
jgi:hypothetical protein